MSIHFKPIQEVPFIDTLETGDKLLVNRNGAAHQIDAEKVGGGRRILYINVTENGENGMMAIACQNPERTVPIAYETGVNMMMQGCVLEFNMGEQVIYYLVPSMFVPDPANKVIMTAVGMGDSMSEVYLIFEDSLI